VRRCSAIFSGGETSGALLSAKPLQWATPVWRELRARFVMGSGKSSLKKEAKLQLGLNRGSTTI
jgi:hypothetical protein